MKMNVIANVGNPTEEKYCLCKDKYGYYAVALPSIINGRFQIGYILKKISKRMI